MLHVHVVMRDKIKTHTRFSFRPKAETTSLEIKSKAEGGSLHWVPRSRTEERLRAWRVGKSSLEPQSKISPRHFFLPFFLCGCFFSSAYAFVVAGNSSLVIKNLPTTAFCNKELNTFSHSAIKLVAVLSSIRIHSSHSFIL